MRTASARACAWAIRCASGIQVNVDHSELDAAAKNAKDAGVDITKVADMDKGTADSLDQLPSIKAEIERDYRNQIKTLNEARIQLEDYHQQKATYDNLKRQYDADLAEYLQKKADYDAAMVQYEKDMAELERLKDTDGYLSKPAPQSLTFLSEPNAVIDVQGKVYSSAEWIATLKSMGYTSGAVFNTVSNYDTGYAPQYNARRVYLEKDKPLKVVYTNLSNSTFDDKKIVKVEYTYTLKTLTNGKDKIPAILYPDPTVTINYSDLDSNIEVQMDVVFYDEDGQKIDMEGGLLSFSSLNRNLDNGVNREEYVRGFNGELIPITGSSIAISGDKATSKLPSNEYKANGSKYDYTEWDGDSAAYPKQWYGAIVGKIGSDGISFRFGSNQRRGIWFALNSNIRAYRVPKKPVEPTEPKAPTEPKKPEISVTYHYNVAYVKSQNVKTVSNEAGQNIQGQTVLTGSVVKFTLETSKLPADRESMEQIVFTDTLPEGYELNLGDTQAASPNYTVTYEAGTRLLTFTADASLLATINNSIDQETAIPSPIVSGTVTKEGTTYENSFDLTINNIYKVQSNPVKIYTPTKPIKNVFNSGNTNISIDGKAVKAGQELLYQVTYKNTTGEARDVTITDKLPDHTTYVDGSATDAGVESGRTITWKKNVEKGQTWTVSFKVTVDKAVNGEVLKNTAKVNDGQNDFTTNETNNPTPTKPVKDVHAPADIQTSIDGTPVKVGQELLYKISYTNTTSERRDVTITDKIPTHTSYVQGSADHDGVENRGTITWTKSVEAGETLQVTFKVSVDPEVNGQVLANTAQVNDGQNEFETNTTKNPTPTKPVKDVVSPGALDTSIDGKLVQAGQELVYKVTYTNTTGEERQVTITDTIPAYTTYKAGSATDGGQEANGVITWNKQVAKGETWTVLFHVTVNDDTNGQVIENTAQTKDGFNDFTTNTTKNPTPTKPVKDVHTPADIQTSIDGTPVKVGQELLYKISYTNTTGENRQVTITDAIPAHTSFVSADKGGREASGVITWKQEVSAGDTLTVTFIVKVDDNVDSQIIENTAQVSDGQNNFTTNTTKNPTSTNLVLAAKKVLTGRTLQAGEFEFVLTDQNGTELETVTNDASGAIAFKALAFDAAGTYTYKISEKAGSLGGVTYDKSVVTATVTVTTETDGKLKAAVDYENNDQVFENSYGASPGKATLTATKVLSGRALRADEFEFVLRDKESNELETVKSAADGSVTFTSLNYDKAGTYTYTISEKAGSLGGVTYDASTITATVEVTDNGIGQLVTKVSYQDNDQQFDNTYKAAPITANLEAKKILTGRALQAGEFEFVLTDQESQAVETVRNTADGSILFSTLTFDKAGTYTYTISEKAGNLGGVTYDASTITATVVVTDDGNGQLLAQVEYANDDQTFENSYGIAPTTATLAVTKVLSGRPLQADEFEFTLTAQNDGQLLETVTNKADGSVTFTPLAYTEAGTYTYTIAEKAGNLGGVTYDSSTITATVVVTDGGNGQFVVDVTYDSQYQQFTNIYKPAPTVANLSASKVLTGRDLQAGEFEFVLIDQEGKELELVKNAADGTVTFSGLSFDKVGTYTYTIKEKQGDIGGITYDASTVVATIEVVDNQQGNLVATVTYANDDQQFDNSYVALPAKANVAAKKHLVGRDLQAGEFEFTLTDQEGNVLETVKNAADGAIIFTPLTFTKAGSYTYTLAEKAGKVGGISYDTNVVTITVTVTDDGQGHLVANLVYSTENPSFNNVYKPTDATVKLVANKVLKGRDLEAGEFDFVLIDQDGKEIQVVKNAADGSISFADLSFNQVGTYTYTISEKQGNLANVTYDTSVITAVVKVEDDGKGRLIATVTYAGDDQTFENTFTPEQPPKDAPPLKMIKKILPKTGEEVASILTVFGFVLLGLVGFVLYKKFKK